MRLPELELSEWEESRLKWQLLCQFIGKLRLKLHPSMNHWWHVPLYVSPAGLTTGDVPCAGGLFAIDLDLLAERIVVTTSTRGSASIVLDDRSVAAIYEEFCRVLADLGIENRIVAKPYKCKSDVPFAEDVAHTTWDGKAVVEAWRVLTEIEPVFKEFRGKFIGKCSPVHMFWHSFDLAVTRFSGRRAPAMPSADAVTQEAYSHEVNSAGFWFGDDTVPEAAFYCYTAPSPEGIERQPLRPAKAFWKDVYGPPMALLLYKDWRVSDDPRSELLEFLQSSYEAGANAAGWDRASLERP